jgi:asparagine synthase (glutamine-hydrolysing)
LELAQRMGQALHHRGPDDAGVSHAQGWTLVHRRLAILDLSAAGHQPMFSASGRLLVVFNGEIYNHNELRQELQARSLAPVWRGHSDTETLLAAIEAWGLDATLARARGMFALALWDEQAHTLTLARDRFGEKPLYYGWVGQGAQRAFAFASDVQAFRAMAGFDSAISDQALRLYFQFMQVPAPWSIYRGVFKLPAACKLVCAGPPPAHAPEAPMQAQMHHGSLRMERWWSLADCAVQGQKSPLLDETQALERLEAVLGQAVRLQGMADVPLGTFLSGGIDSSLVTALLQAHSSTPVRTFTMGFAQADHDEAIHARAVAAHLGTQHQEWLVTPQEALEAATRMADVYAEPFADSSQIPTWMVCGHAKSSVTVALTGDGADELFGGYNRHIMGPRIARVPPWLRDATGRLLRAVPARWWASLDGQEAVGLRRWGEKLHRLARSLDGGQSLDDMHVRWMSATRDEWLPLRDGNSLVPSISPDWLLPPEAALGPLERMLYRDAMSYMTDDVLHKVDRAAMAHSLETRAPFLDADVAAFAWQLPASMKVRGGRGKWILRQLLGRHLPPHLFDRPKSGFAVPLSDWLRGPMRQSMEQWVSSPATDVDGCLDMPRLSRMWQQHKAHQIDHSQVLWAYWMFQQWAAGNRCAA